MKQWLGKKFGVQDSTMLLSLHCFIFAIMHLLSLLFKVLAYEVFLGKTCSGEMRKTCWFFEQYLVS